MGLTNHLLTGMILQVSGSNPPCMFLDWAASADDLSLESEVCLYHVAFARVVAGSLSAILVFVGFFTTHFEKILQ